VVLVFHIDAGTVEDVDVSNLTVAVLADTPPLMADGNWRVGVFMDSAASQEQAESSGRSSPASSAGRWPCSRR
jgi:hypothetical protein